VFVSMASRCKFVFYDSFWHHAFFGVNFCLHVVVCDGSNCCAFLFLYCQSEEVNLLDVSEEPRS
jgi:hypothetical protein